MSLSRHRLRGLGVIGARSGGASQRGLSGSQSGGGACRSEGLERLVAGEHVPDRLGESAGDVDLGDFGAALAAEPAFGALVALLEERVCGRRAIAASISAQRRYLGPCLDSGPRRSCPGLVHPGAQSGVAGQLHGRGEPVDVADLGGDRVAE